MTAALNKPGAGNLIRAFIAIELPQEVRAYLKTIQSKLRQPGDTVKWVDPANLHLTLKFLGNIAPSQIDPVAAAVLSAVEGVHPFNLTVQQTGAFPSPARPQVLWVGLTGDLEPLFNLQKNLDARLVKTGFAPETRPFSPHLTIGRLRETASLSDKQNLGRVLSGVDIPSKPAFAVNTLKLMQSRLLPSGPLYSCINSFDIR